jgi:hypothetical protein
MAVVMLLGNDKLMLQLADRSAKAPYVTVLYYFKLPSHLTLSFEI